MSESRGKHETDAYNEDVTEILNELVHDVASEIASNAINAGEQEDWLLSQGWTQEQIAEHVQDKLAEKGYEV